MRLLTFSFLKNCKHKHIYRGVTRTLSLQPEIVLPGVTVTADPNLLDISPTWAKDVEPELRAAVQEDMKVIPNFISEEEENAMVTELEPQLKRMRYEFDHWDNAIHGFRETEKSHWSPVGEAVLARVRAAAFSAGSGAPMPHAHVLDLAPSGYIKPHVDAVRYCGEVIAGLCLLSSAVMHLEHEHNKDLTLDALLLRRSLYIMRGSARYSFSHAVSRGERSTFRAQAVPRRRRVAVICRSTPRTDPRL